jgi:hypothetical protein
MGPPFRTRYQFHAKAGSATLRFSAVAALTETGLLLVGFDRLGAQVFALRQAGTGIEIVLPPRRGFLMAPITVLGAIHRARFLGLGQADPEGGTRVRACGIEIRLWKSAQGSSTKPVKKAATEVPTAARASSACGSTRRLLPSSS